MEEKEQPERDEGQASGGANDRVVIAEPAERAQRLREGDSGQEKRRAQSRGVRREEDRPTHDLLGAREDEDRGENRPDARRGTYGKGGTEESARAALPRATQEPGSDDPLGPRQQADEREPQHDEDEAGELGLAVGVEQAADRSRPGAQEDEDDREAGDEGQARKHDAPRRARVSEAVRLHGGDRREVPGHEREDAGRDDGDEPRQERHRDPLEHELLALVEAGEFLVEAALERGIELRRGGDGLTGA